MTDISELVKRLRAYPANRLYVQVADALEAELRTLAKEIAELEYEAHLFDEALEIANARIAELEAAIEPFRRVKAITSIYEYVPIEALRDDEQFNFKMNGAEMKTIYALLNGKD